jgi:hypothetical protein
MFVLPSLCLGFIGSVPCLALVLPVLFQDDADIDATPLPSAPAVRYALAVGLVIPLLSAIIPIQAALSKDLHASLDSHKSKLQALSVEVLEAGQAAQSAFLAFGSLSFVYGLIVYYVTPLALLSLDFATMLSIFLFVLAGLLCGLSLLAFNFQRFLEIVFTRMFLFWETASMRMLVLKNLDAHRSRNKMTALIYSISLGFIIFLVVSSSLVLTSTQKEALQESGAYLQFSANFENMISPQAFDGILKEHADIIEDFGFITPKLSSIMSANVVKVAASDYSRIHSIPVDVFGVQPAVSDASINDFMQLFVNKGALPPTE